MLTEYIHGIYVSNIKTSYNKNIYKKYNINIIINCSLDYDSKAKVQLPHELERWIEASNISNNLKEC